MATAFNFRQWPLLPFLLLYIIGILCYVYHWYTPSLLVKWWLPALFFLVIGLILLKLFPGTRSKSVSMGFFALATILLGFGRTAQVDVRNNSRWFGHSADAAVCIIVQLKENPKEKARTVLLNAQVKFALLDSVWQKAEGELLVYVYKNENMPQFKAGEQWIIPAALVLIQHNNNPGSFDFAAKQKREGLYYQTFLDYRKMQLYSKSSGLDFIENLRASLLFQLDTFITHPTTKSLTQATLLNEADNLDPQMQQDYANTGISHIIAISGMHVNLLFYLLVSPMFWIRDKRKLWLKYLLVLPFVWIYVTLCHFPPSAVRAAVGFTLITIALLIKRPQDNIHLLQINAFVLLLYYPMWLFHIGVQLSFLAVLSILIFYPKMKALMATKYRALNWVGEVAAVSIAVQILVFPLVIYYFHQFPIWFLPANLLAALFSILQMGMAFLIMLFGLIGWSSLAVYIGKGLSVMTMYFNKIIAWLNQHSFDFGKALPMDSLDFLLIMLAIVLLSIFWYQRKLWTLYAGLIVVVGFVLNLVLIRLTYAKQERIIVFAGARQSVLAYFKGGCATLFADSLNEHISRFQFEPACLHFRAVEVKTKSPASSYWEVDTKRIAYLKDLSKLPAAELDILILSVKAQLTPSEIRAAHGRPLIVLDSSFGRTASLKYEGRLSEEGFVVHNTARNGAWWFYSEK
jgi:competence protein ComEC